MMKLNIQLFGHTGETDNYDLPQFVGTDKPTWLGDFNSAMSAIDAGMAENASDITSLGTRVTSAESTATQASTDVASLQSTVSTLSTNVTSVTSTANNAQSTATSALSTANSAQSTANSADGKADANATKIGDLTDLDTTAKTDIVSAINEVNEKNIMSITLSSTYTVPTTNTLLSVTGFSLLNSVGDKLTFSNNKIVIGAGVSKVLVSYSAEALSNASSNLIIYLSVGSNYITQETVKFTASNQIGEAVCTPMLISVNENDAIGLTVYTTQGNKITGQVDGRNETVITVQVVE